MGTVFFSLSQKLVFMVRCWRLSPELRNKLEETVVASVTIVPKSCLWRKERNNQIKTEKEQSKTPKDESEKVEQCGGMAGHGACVRRVSCLLVSGRQKLSSAVPRKMALTLEVTVGLGAHSTCSDKLSCEMEECVGSDGLTLPPALYLGGT